MKIEKKDTLVRTYHNYENPDEDCSKISEEVQRVLHIVQIPKVSSLNYFLGVIYDVANKQQKAKVKLQI